MLQGCQHKVVTILLYQACHRLVRTPCNKSDNFDQVVTSCQQVVPNLLTTCDKQCEYILLTACEQTCNKLVRFYVCILLTNDLFRMCFMHARDHQVSCILLISNDVVSRAV
jgi:hypothetical protein